jgi:glycosyltransferase involved in cell wall biosynthesis
MRINFALWSTMMTGGVRAIFEVINGLSERGHEITITALDGDHSWFPLEADVNYIHPPGLFKIFNPLSRYKWKRPVSYPMIDHLTSKTGFHIDLISRLSQAIPECDVNVATWYPTAFAVNQSGRGVPFYFFMDFDELARIDGDYNYRLFREGLKLPLNIITISSWLKKWVMDYYQKDAVVCGCGINHDVFYPRKHIYDELNGPKILGIFAELEYKGKQDLIDALNLLSEELPDFHLLAVSSKARTFQALLQKNNFNFEYTLFERPSDQKLAQLYSSADLFAFSSHVEGFGLPPLEAMACGTAVVTTDCLGMRDYAIDGENSVIVPPKNPKMMASGIKKILTNETLRKKLETHGVETASKFTWENVACNFEKAIIDVINQKTSKNSDLN